MKIICFGDSLTRGVTYVKGRVRILKENYPALLERKLLSSYSEDLVILNKGVFNDNSHLLIKRLEKDVISHKPDYVLINIGGNDCNFNWPEVVKDPNNSHMPIVSIHDYLANVRKIITTLKEFNIKPVIITLPPLNPVKYYKFLASQNGTSISHWICSCGGIEYWHSLYNTHLNSLIKELHLECIDIREGLMKVVDYQELFSEDGIHLNQQGYNEMSEIIYTNLEKIIHTNS
ncbi:SGNH/GDSL hydrolase family protein [Bacillus sp. B1-b2]|uniref:SGNH/GDSL hydrolase family protein n=1 Tax=Bacillus sp. B1-b2 TaxID=2653201 RepID=UPI001261D172|nr:SGNH/GDSL hydrolase family protein [Bacillus sp. B1-b2]KAB7671122.1 SGNH/GDSL hydrolase family protein [Bacillus sp. B1-b2]